MCLIFLCVLFKLYILKRYLKYLFRYVEVFNEKNIMFVFMKYKYFH